MASLHFCSIPLLMYDISAALSPWQLTLSYQWRHFVAGAPLLLLFCQFHLSWSRSQPDSCSTSGWSTPGCNSLLILKSHCSLQMESGCFSVLLAGTVPALAASLAVVAVFQLAGALLACCLARYCSLQIPIVYHPQPHLGWLPLRRGNGMSSVITDRREGSGTYKARVSANCGCFSQKRKVWNLAMGSSCSATCSPVFNLHYCLSLLFPTHYFDNSIVKGIYLVAILLYFYSSICYARVGGVL